MNNVINFSHQKFEKTKRSPFLENDEYYGILMWPKIRRLIREEYLGDNLQS